VANLGRHKKALVRTASIALAIWIAMAAWGAFRLISQVPPRVTAERGQEDSLRNSIWSPIYGFADVCQSGLAVGASVLLVDPTGSPVEVSASDRTGPAAFGLPGDLDWPNQAVFAYVLYPRPVSAIGHAPQNPQSAAGSAGYIAVWEQHSYRSQDAQAAARRAESDFRSANVGQVTCEYTSPDGDRGVVFRTSKPDVGAAGAAPAPAPPAGGRVAAYSRVLLGLASLWVVGFLMVRLLAAGGLPHLLVTAAALPLGCMAVSAQLIAYSTAGISWSGLALGTPWLVVAGAALWKDRLPVQEWLPRLSLRPIARAWQGLGTGERLGLAALAGLCLLVTIAAPLGLPWSDGFNLYYFKSRAFFSDGSTVPYYQHAGSMLFSFPAHPPVVPLSVTWLYLWLGEADEHASLLLWPAIYVSMLTALYALLRTSLPRPASIWYTLAFGLIGYELSTQALLASFADLPLAAYLLLACGALWFWAGGKKRPIGALVLAGMSLGAAALTKEEGLVAAVIILAATPLLLSTQASVWSRSRWSPAAVVAPVFAVIAGPWLLLRLGYHLPELTVHLGGGSTVLGRLPAAVTGLGIRALLPMLPFLALAAAAVLIGGRSGWRQWLTGRVWFLLFVVAAQLAVDAAAIAAAPVEVHHQVAIAASRLVSQVVPILFLAFAESWAGLIWPARVARRDRDEAAPPAKAAAPTL
jgi:hypothetical protein